MEKKWKYLVAVLLIVLVGFRFGALRFNEHPSHIHAWAESDRIALAHGFVDNNLNFFQPQTYTLNHQFPSNFFEQHSNSRTSVDFPIHDFVPAVIMKITGSKDIRIFQGYILLYSFIGMFFLFRLSELFVKNEFLSLGILFLAVTSPVFMYYQGGFLPSIPSLSNTIIGLFYYFKYRKENKLNYFGWFIFFLTLAALARTTFAIPLIALAGIEVLSVILKKANPQWIKRGVYFVIAFAVIGGYFLYNSYLRTEYHSMFLNSFIPADSWDEIKTIFSRTMDNWKKHYFIELQYILMIILALLGVLSMIFIRHKKNKERAYFLFFIFIYLIGLFMFSYLLMRQFIDHDYYFLDTYYLWMLLLLIYFVSFLPKSNKKLINALYLVPIISLGIPILSKSPQTQNDRKTVRFWSTGYPAMVNYTGSEEFLDSLGITKNAVILQLDATSPNGQLTQMKRKGLVAMYRDKDFLSQIMDWKYDYIVCQNDVLYSSIYMIYPEILDRLEKIGDNGKISVFKKGKGQQTTLKSFLGIVDRQPIKSIDVDQRYLSDSSDCIFIPSEDLYPIGAFDENADYLNSNSIAYISFNVRNVDEVESESSSEGIFVVSDNNEINQYTKHIPIMVDKNSSKVEFALQVPTNVTSKSKYGLYMFNNKEYEFEIEDFVFEVYRK